MGTYVLAAVLGAILLVFLLGFNSLVRLRQMTRSAWADVDVYLKRRSELIPNLVAAVKAYAAHEQTVLEAVAEARSQALALPGPTVAHAQAEARLAGTVVNVLALAEQYPELKASENFADLQRQLSETERHIASARQYFNACVRDLNTRIEAFPSNVVAGMSGFKHANFFELENVGERASPHVSGLP